MRKGRGLVDVDIYNELLEVPGSRELLLDNTTNHRLDPRTKKLRVEISEDAWPEVKLMVQNWKHFRAGKEQLDAPKKKQPKRGPMQVEEKSEEVVRIEKERAKHIKKIKNLMRGDAFAYKNSGFGFTSYESGDEIIGRKKGRLFTDCFDSVGLEWTGETWKFDGGLGMVTSIVLPEDVPEGELSD